MPIPKGMTEQEKRMYWGVVAKIVKNGGTKEQGEKAAYTYIKNKRKEKK